MVSYHRVRVVFALILLFGLLSIAPASSSQATSQALSHVVIDGSGIIYAEQWVTIGADGLGLIAYGDKTAKAIKVAHCNDVACRTATITPIISYESEDYNLQIAIGIDGLGKITYNLGGQIFLASCQNIRCTSIQSTPITTRTGGGDIRLLIGRDNNPIIIFGVAGTVGGFNNKIDVAHCEDPQCQNVTVRTILDNQEDPLSLVAAIGSDGLPVVLYFDNAIPQHNLLHCTDIGCQNTTIAELVVDPHTQGSSIALAIGHDGFPIVVYQAQPSQLGILHCENVLCTDYSNIYYDEHWLGGRPSVIINGDGFPLIVYPVYQNQQWDLYASRCSDFACNDITTHLLDDTTNVGIVQEMVLGNDGFGLIAYHDMSRAQLRVIHCKDIACSEDGVNLFAQYVPMLMQTPTSMVVPINATAIPDQAVTTLGQVFFTTSISIPQPIPSGGRYVLAGNAQGTTPSVVDDKVVLKAGNQTIFEFEYGGTGTPNPTLVEVPNAIIESHIGQTITIEFRDVYGGRIQASTMYLVWIP